MNYMGKGEKKKKVQTLATKPIEVKEN